MLFRISYLLGIVCLIFPTVRVPLLRIGISDFFILSALAVLVWENLRLRGADGWGIPMHVLWIPSLMVLIGGLLSSFGAAVPTTSVEITIKTVFVLSVWISMSMVMVQRGDLQLTMVVFLAAVCASAAIGLVDISTGTNFGDRLSGNTIIFYNRSDGTLGHPNELGYITSVAVPLALGFLLRELQTRRRPLFILAFGAAVMVCALALFSSGSVAGWLTAAGATGVFAIIWLLRATRLQKLVLFCALLLVVVAGAVSLTDPQRQADIQFLIAYNLNRAENRSGPGRLRLLAQAFDVIGQDPFVGAGMDQTGTGNLTKEELVTADVIHNTLIGGWLAGGVLVFVGLLISYLAVFLTALSTLWRGFQTADWLAVGLGACALGWILFDQTQPNLYHRYTWLTVAWMFGLGLHESWSIRPVSPGAAESRDDVWHPSPASISRLGSK